MHTTHPTHLTIRHAERVYASGHVHTQTIKGFFGNVKNGIAGNYHGVSVKWPQSYIRGDGRAMFAEPLRRAARTSPGIGEP